jgi:hypothetical protein
MSVCLACDHEFSTSVDKAIDLTWLRKTSTSLERKNAKKVGGKTTRGSGCGKKEKADFYREGKEQPIILTGSRRFEHKFTTHASFQLKLEELKKLQAELKIGETGIFQVDFISPTKTEIYWVIKPADTEGESL